VMTKWRPLLRQSSGIGQNNSIEDFK